MGLNSGHKNHLFGIQYEQFHKEKYQKSNLYLIEHTPQEVGPRQFHFQEYMNQRSGNLLMQITMILMNLRDLKRRIKQLIWEKLINKMSDGSVTKHSSPISSLINNSHIPSTAKSSIRKRIRKVWP